MNPTWRANPELKLWLWEATRDLIPSVAASVREELTEHFEEACKQHLDGGLSAASAAELALRDLGSPKKANRRLRKVWPTEAESAVFERAALKYKEYLDSSARSSISIPWRFVALWLGAGAVASIFAAMESGLGAWIFGTSFFVIVFGLPGLTLLVLCRSIRPASLPKCLDAFILLDVFGWRVAYMLTQLLDFPTHFYAKDAQIQRLSHWLAFPPALMAGFANALVLLLLGWIFIGIPANAFLKYLHSKTRANSALPPASDASRPGIRGKDFQ